MRKKKGSSVIELAISCTALTIIAILCIDAAVVVFCSVVHDRCCREATRAASKGRTKTDALALARATLAANRSQGGYLTTPTFADSELIFTDYSGSPQPDQVPTVVLTTHAQIRIPATIKFAEALFAVNNGQLDSSIKYTFPLTNLQANIPTEAP